MKSICSKIIFFYVCNKTVHKLGTEKNHYFCIFPNLLPTIPLCINFPTPPLSELIVVGVVMSGSVQIDFTKICKFSRKFSCRKTFWFAELDQIFGEQNFVVSLGKIATIIYICFEHS